MRRLEKAYQNFFRRWKQQQEEPGFPRFKAPNRFDAIEIPACAEVGKQLSERWHCCECGCSIHRDVNAARNILLREPARMRPAEPNVETIVRMS